MGELRLDDQLCFALYAATAAITRRYRAPLADIGLTYPQYLAMLVLWREGPSTVGDVADRLALDSHAVSPVVARLSDAGLVTRTRGEDRRTVLVEATARGRELEADAARVQSDVACATGLEHTDLVALRDELHALTLRLAPSPTAPPTRTPAVRATTPPPPGETP